MKLAAITGGALTVAIVLGAVSAAAAEGEPQSPAETRPPVAFVFEFQATRPSTGFRAMSLDFAQGPLLGSEAGAVPAHASAWRQPFGPGGSAGHTSSNSTAVFTSIDLGGSDRAEPRWKQKNWLETGVPPRDDESHIGEAVARGVLGFVLGRAIAELANPQPGRTAVKLRSASDPHGKGVGLRLSASW